MKKFFCYIIINFFVIKLFANIYDNTEDKKFPNLNFTGYAGVRYTVDTQNNDGFSISYARFGIKGNVSKDVVYIFAMENTNLGNSNIDLLYDLFLNINSIPYFSLRMGQFKYNFGYEQNLSDVELDFVNKSEVIKNLISPTRDLGIEVTKKFKFLSLNQDVSIGIYNGSGANKQDDNEDKTFVGKINFVPENYTKLNFGISTYLGNVNVTKVIKNRFGINIDYEIKKICFKTEYLKGKDDNVEKDGYYFTLLYNLNSSLVFLVRYDSYDNNLNLYDDIIKRLTFGINYFLDKNVSLRTNFELKNETPEIENNLLITQFQIKF
jgi:phosphate-selective porin